MDIIMEIVKNLDWTPLFISFKTGIVATVISFFLGLFAARACQSDRRRISDAADGSAADRCRIFPAVVI